MEPQELSEVRVADRGGGGSAAPAGDASAARRRASAERPPRGIPEEGGTCRGRGFGEEDGTGMGKRYENRACAVGAGKDRKSVV